ncbi:hypothetical protein [uncultured Nitratireductor sp.]|uniref:hypothetical protein n=1 Tax=uncultured Nitratireductor sp. TaxID=520953 RepID=UPI0025EAC320|nr:hypothetical protein [uncultured Nitratireductor sp.]
MNLPDQRGHSVLQGDLLNPPFNNASARNAASRNGKEMPVKTSLQQSHDLERNRSAGPSAKAVDVQPWARRTALLLQEDQQFASMLQRISKPEASENVVFISRHAEGVTDFSSAAVAYRESGDD